MAGNAWTVRHGSGVATANMNVSNTGGFDDTTNQDEDLPTSVEEATHRSTDFNPPMDALNTSAGARHGRWTRDTAVWHAICCEPLP
jgi:hypothetical protein